MQQNKLIIDTENKHLKGYTTKKDFLEQMKYLKEVMKQ